MELSFFDARKARYNAQASKPVFVKLRPKDDSPGMCARLN